MDDHRQSLDPVLSSLVSLRKSNNDLCVTQFYPAWSLHALLRFCNFSYKCGNSDINTSLGMALPHLQDGHYVYSLRMALEHLENRRQQLDEPPSMQQEEEPSSTTSTTTIITTETIVGEKLPSKSSKLSTSSNKYKSSIETSPDIVMASHIDHITNIYNQYNKLSNSNVKDFYKSTTWIANLFITGWLRVSYSLFRNDNDFTLSITEKYEPYPDSTKEELLNRLQEAYSELAARLEKYSGSLFKIPRKKDSQKSNNNNNNTNTNRRISDALLFDHLATGLCNEEVSIMIEKHPALMSFFTSICKEYFSSPTISNKSVKLSWHMATNQILHNKFLSLDKCKKVKEAITPIDDIQYPREFQNFNFYTINNNTTHLTTIRTHYHDFYNRIKKMKDRIYQGKLYTDEHDIINNDDNNNVSTISSNMCINITMTGTVYLLATLSCFVGYAGIITYEKFKNN